MTGNWNYRVVISILITLIYLLSLYLTTRFDYTNQFEGILMWYLVSFSLFLLIIRKIPVKYLWALLSLSLILFLFDFPNLTVDYYRFIWDGEIATKGYSAYRYTPEQLITHFRDNNYLASLYHGMSDLSKSNPTVYTPINQLFFRFSAFLTDDLYTAITILRMILISSHLMTGLYLIKFLKSIKRSEKLAWFYLLNPLVLQETIYNIHFEGMMVMFLCISFYFLVRQKWLVSSLFWSVSINFKLLPIVLLPFIFRKVKIAVSSLIYVLITITTLILFYLSFDKLEFGHFMDGMRLYFGVFEFNSSILELFLHYGKWKYDWNMTRIYAPYLSRITIKIILLLSLIGIPENWNGVFLRMTIALFLYFLLSSTVHPWYLITMLFLGVISGFSSIVLWSMTIVLSYAFYDPVSKEYFETLRWIEYLPVVSLFIYEVAKGGLLIKWIDRHSEVSACE